jgi:hexosaminidase
MKKVLLLIGLFSPLAWGQQSRIFPQPSELTETSENLTFQGNLSLETTEDSKVVIPYLHQLFEAEKGIHLELSTAKNPQITLHRNEEFSAESYMLEVNKTGIHIDYADLNGLRYAFTSLVQWIENDQLVKGVRIMDQPRFNYRGTHLDCSRHFFTIPELERFIDELALLKINKFHWHLTDDQGWRIEIKAFPALTQVGAYRDSTLIGHFSAQPVQYDHERYGGFYTQQQAKDLVAYAAERGITIIPEIEMPGHARAALAAYPELGCTVENKGVAGTWGVFNEVFCSKPQTLDFMKTVLGEIIAIFPSETIHIGGDEAPKVAWDHCPNCLLQRLAHGLNDSHELQRYFIEQMERYLRERGRKLIGWDEILDGGLAENAQVMSWRGTEGGIAAAKAGHQVVMTPTSHCYFDYYQSSQPNEPLAIGGFLPLSKVYAFEPVPTALNANEARFIIGGQANLWTEYLPTMNAVYYQAFPRLVAMAQVLWCEHKPHYDAFAAAMATEYLPRLKAKNIPYSTAFLDINMGVKSVNEGIEIQPSTSVKTYFTMPSVSEKDTINKIVIKRTKNKVVNHCSIVTWYESKAFRTTDFNFTSHLALGKVVHFETKPSEKYNIHDSLGLTDGVVGQLPWKGDQWLGFDSKTVVFTIDMTQPTKFGHLSLRVLNDPGSWIYAPQNYRIEWSNDGVTMNPYAEGKITDCSIECSKKIRARYVKVTLYNYDQIPSGQPGEGYTPWTFVDELILTR